MIDDITAMQSRISEIQSRIASLTPGNPDSMPDPANAGSATVNQPSFAQVLGQRIRLAPGGGAEPSLTPPSTDPGIPYGRKPFVPYAPPLPGLSTSPFVPERDQVVPSKSSRVDDYQTYIDKYSAANGLSPTLVKAVIQTESDGDPNCVSTAGAMGLMQLMPGDVQDAGVTNPFDPEQNIAAGTKQLSDLLTRYNGNLDLALAGYNAGPGKVAKYGGVPPYPETQNYIRKVRAIMGAE